MTLPQILRALRNSHPNIIRLFGSGSDGPYHNFLLLEHLPGGTLLDRLTVPNPTPPRRAFRGNRAATTASLRSALTCALQLASALVYLHEHALESREESILHLALKPEDIAFAADGSLRLLGFGAASIVPYGSTRSSGARVTDPRQRKFAAPEALLGLPCGAAADTFSFTVLLWSMLAHKLPHADLSDSKVGEQVSAWPHLLTGLIACIIVTYLPCSSKHLMTSQVGPFDAVELLPSASASAKCSSCWRTVLCFHCDAGGSARAAREAGQALAV